jgi:hypothetical protein
MRMKHDREVKKKDPGPAADANAANNTNPDWDPNIHRNPTNIAKSLPSGNDTKYNCDGVTRFAFAVSVAPRVNHIGRSVWHLSAKF